MINEFKNFALLILGLGVLPFLISTLIANADIKELHQQQLEEAYDKGAADGNAVLFNEANTKTIVKCLIQSMKGKDDV